MGTDRKRDPALVHRDEVEAFEPPPTSSRAIEALWRPLPVCQEIEQVAPSQDAEDLTCFGHQDGRSVFELSERRLDRIVELHHGDGRRHHFGDVGLEHIGIAEDPVEQLAVADRSDELRHVGAVFADDRRLRDVAASARSSPDAPCRARRP